MRRTFVSVDRRTTCEGEYDEPDRYRHLALVPADRPVVARCAGLSYVAASFGEGVRSIGMGRFNRLLGFDAQEKWIDVEAGITVGALYDFCGGHGLALPVQPGHPQITIGGCIAGNVHGKNPYRDGLFGDHVRRIRLFHPAHGFLDLSRDCQPDLFELTLGGLGLTGIIVTARLSLVPVTSRFVGVEHLPVESFAEALALLRDLRADREMVYAWLDLASLSRPGRGYAIVASSVDDGGGENQLPVYRRLNPARNRFRPRLLTSRTLPVINRLYYYLGTRSHAQRRLPRAEVLFPALGKELYFDGYGASGFFELQAVVPEDAANEYASKLAALVRKRGQPVGLTTLKPFRGPAKLLRYTGTGFSFTVDVPATRASLDLLSDLDELNCDVGAVTALIKDSRLSASVARRQYRDYARFKEQLHSFDPDRRFASALSRRLEL